MTLKLIAPLFILLLFVQCKKKEAPYELYLYTTDASHSGLTLFVDGVEKGALPVVSSTVMPDDESAKALTLHLTLPTGKYVLEAKDEEGNLQKGAKLQFSSHKETLTGIKAGCEVRSLEDDHCMTVRFFE